MANGAFTIPEKLRHLAQVLGFCLIIAVLFLGFQPGQSFAPTLIHSTCIGVIIWAVVDFGRHLLPSPEATGWPAPLPAAALVLCAIALGFVGGNQAADAISGALGLHQPGRLNVGSVGSVWSSGRELRISLLITLIAGTVCTYYFFSRGRSAHLKRQAEEAQRLAAEAQRLTVEAKRLSAEARLKLLEAQLEPHMLFNTLANLHALIGADPARAQQMLDHIRMVPVGEVLYLEAADKYVRVLTADGEYLIRTPLKELLPRLDARDFWQVHRGTVVRAGAIARVERDEAGKLSLSLRGRKERLAVSRLYAYLFKAM